MEINFDSLLKTAETFRNILKDIDCQEHRVDLNFNRLPKEKQPDVRDYYDNIRRCFSDIRSDLKGYASLVLEYELEKIAAATARTEDGQESEASC